VSGTLVLRFVGPSVGHGEGVVAEGTPGLVHGILVMINPVYSFTGRGWSSATSW